MDNLKVSSQAHFGTNDAPNRKSTNEENIKHVSGSLMLTTNSEKKTLNETDHATIENHANAHLE